MRGVIILIRHGSGLSGHTTDPYWRSRNVVQEWFESGDFTDAYKSLNTKYPIFSRSEKKAISETRKWKFDLTFHIIHLIHSIGLSSHENENGKLNASPQD